MRQHSAWYKLKWFVFKLVYIYITPSSWLGCCTRSILSWIEMVWIQSLSCRPIAPPWAVENSCDIVANVMKCNKIASEFELQTYCYIHFWMNTQGEGENSLMSPCYRLNSTTIALLQGWILISNNPQRLIWFAIK